MITDYDDDDDDNIELTTLKNPQKLILNKI